MFALIFLFALQNLPKWFLLSSWIPIHDEFFPFWMSPSILLFFVWQHWFFEESASPRGHVLVTPLSSQDGARGVGASTLHVKTPAPIMPAIHVKIVPSKRRAWPIIVPQTHVYSSMSTNPPGTVSSISASNTRTGTRQALHVLATQRQQRKLTILQQTPVVYTNYALASKL